MFELKILEESVRSVGDIVKRWLPQIITMTLLVDVYLAVVYKTNLLSINLTWLEVNINFQDAVLAAVLVSGLLVVGVPLIHFFLRLPGILVTEWLLFRYARDEQWVLGVRETDLLNYALTQDNSVAYQEYLRQIEEKEQFRRVSLWLSALSVALALNLLAPIPPNCTTLMREVWAAVVSLPLILRAVVFVAGGLTLLWLGLVSIFAVRFTHLEYLSVPSEAFYMNIRNSLISRKDVDTTQ